MDYLPPPKSPMVQQKKTLVDVLGSGMNEKLKLRQVMQKYQGYDAPKAPNKKAFSPRPDSVDL